MTARAAAVAALLPLLPVPLQAQWGGYVSFGARYGTLLVSDVIVDPIDVRQAIAPVIGLGLTTLPDRSWSGEAALDVTFTTMQRDEPGETVDLGGLTTLSFTVAVRREVPHGLTARAGVELPGPLANDTWISCRLIPYGPEQQLVLVRDITASVRMERTRRDFVANASHELRTPLTVISGYLEALAEDDSAPAQWRQPVLEMRTQSKRMVPPSATTFSERMLSPASRP